MKITRMMSTAFFSLLLGATTLLCTQGQLYAQDQRDDAKPEQQDARPEPNKDADKPATDKAKSPQQDQAKPEGQAGQEDKPAKAEDKQARPADDKAAMQEHSAQSNQAAGHGGRIPDDKFHASFGRQHTFAIQRTTIQGQPGFQYGGYSFTLIDVWPVGWAYTDQCYVDYIDGEYFLFDLAHPGVRIAIAVVL
ncbi:MAG TPA: hypothetical protein VN946_00210 [Terriglobales bacterium]|jgi:hypothetical protein|nr:hypothetical protein [Terriglobales bacterium]